MNEINQYPIGDKIPTEWEYKSINFFKISVKSNGGDILFYISFTKKYGIDRGINDVISELQENSSGASFTESPLDINISDNCWIIFELDRNINWQFSRDSPHCLTTKLNKYSNYFNLRHVTKENIFNGGTPPGENCNFIYFAVGKKDSEFKNFNDAFNLHVEFLQKRYDGTPQRLKLLIDPEVRNPGGTSA